MKSVFGTLIYHICVDSVIKNNRYLKFFFQKVSITIIVPFKEGFFAISKILLKRTFWYRQQPNAFLSSVSSVSEAEKSHLGAKSSEYGGWLRFFMVKTSRTSIDVWVGALSWCKIHDWFSHNSKCFWRIYSHNRRITSRLYSLLPVRSCGNNSWYTTPLQ